MTTKADEKIAEAKEKLSEAYKALLMVLDEETHGHDEFTEVYIDTVQESMQEILRVKRKL